MLREVQLRTSRGLNTISFPAGAYVADFKTKEGIYFRAPTKIVVRALGMNIIRRGGLFVPFSDDGEHLIDNESAKWVRVHGSDQIGESDRHGAIQRTRNLNAPSSENIDRRHAAWFDQQEGSGGLLAFGLTSPKNQFRFNAPIAYEIQKTAEKTNSN
jgi:hypothetical protein